MFEDVTTERKNISEVPFEPLHPPVVPPVKPPPPPGGGVVGPLTVLGLLKLAEMSLDEACLHAEGVASSRVEGEDAAKGAAIHANACAGNIEEAIEYLKGALMTVAPVAGGAA